MKTYRSTTMKLLILLCHLVLIVRVEAQGPVPDVCIGHSSFKAPESSDMTVRCGTEFMELDILLCPVYHSRYNESLMVLNGQTNKPECYGVPDKTVDPPILKFKFPINGTSSGVCSNIIRLIDGVGTGTFADFSNVQHINISGTVNSVDPSIGTITYRSQVLYLFSCLYPMQYLLNNTQLGVSGVNLAIKDNNGSFISTLTMDLYSDAGYTQPLFVPQTGLNLKTKIFVGVKATNLTKRFNVLLDRCYATVSPHPVMLTYYDLFVGCDHDPQTQVNVNGDSQQALFEFEAFRFVEHKNLSVSTFYLHCITRLCDVNMCQRMKPVCDSNRRRREVEESIESENVTLTSTAIKVSKDERSETPAPESAHSDSLIPAAVTVSHGTEEAAALRASAQGSSVQTTYPLAFFLCLLLFAFSS